jgi:Protein of unknown function (DUF1565)
MPVRSWAIGAVSIVAVILAAAPIVGAARSHPDVKAAGKSSLATGCAATPHRCGFPDATNTGPPPGAGLTSVPATITSPTSQTGRGWVYDGRHHAIDVDANHAVLENVATSVPIIVTASNAMIRNVRDVLDNPDGFGIWLEHTRNDAVENCLIAAVNKRSGRLEAGIKDIYGDSRAPRILQNNIYDAATGVQIDTGLIQGNYIHDPGYRRGDHINGTTSNGSDGPLLKIEHNTVFNDFAQTDAISLFEDFGRQSNRIIDDNIVAGGGYCIYGGQNPGGKPISHIRITNNRFSTRYFRSCGRYGPVAAFTTKGIGNTFKGNVWDATGAPVRL